MKTFIFLQNLPKYSHIIIIPSLTSITSCNNSILINSYHVKSSLHSIYIILPHPVSIFSHTKKTDSIIGQTSPYSQYFKSSSRVNIHPIPWMHFTQDLSLLFRRHMYIYLCRLYRAVAEYPLYAAHIHAFLY